MSLALRTRLALWYAVTLAAALGGLGLLVYGWVQRTGQSSTDARLASVARAFAQLWAAAPERPGADLLSAAHADNVEIVVLDESRREIASNSRSIRLRRSLAVAAPVQDTTALLRRPDLAPLFRGGVDSVQGRYADLTGPLGVERAYALAVPVAGRRQVVAVIEGQEQQAAFLRSLRRTLWLAVPVALVVAFLGGGFLAGRALRPVGVMAGQAAGIGAATLHERLPEGPRGTELGELAAAFNRLLGRLEAAFEQQRRFMAEASHELRTPIAVVRGEADLSLTREHRPEGEYREALEVIRAESRRMSRVVEDLFLLAKADAGELKARREPVELGAVAAEAVRSVQTVAQRRRVTVACAVEAPVTVEGDAALLGRVVLNLVDNAIRYGREGGKVQVTVGREDGRAVLRVADDGPGMAAEVQARVFDRFYRGPEARAADGEGSGGPEAASGAGLGLAIARGIVEAHGGTLVLERSDGRGTVFRMTMVAVAGPAPALAMTGPGQYS